MMGSVRVTTVDHTRSTGGFLHFYRQFRYNLAIKMVGHSRHALPKAVGTVKRDRLRGVSGLTKSLPLLMGECMLDEDSVRRLRCPVTLGKLTRADAALIERVNRLIDAGGAPTRGGQPQCERLEGGLVTDDRRHLYPIQDGIVCMLVESAIELELVNDAPG